MAEKNINSRIIHKHDVEANWMKAANFIPMKGEIIVYDVDDTCNYERFKIGDGVTLVSALSFVNEIITDEKIDAICGGYIAYAEDVMF